MTMGDTMDSLFAGLTTLSLNPAGRLERMRQERTVVAIRAKMDPRFATSRALLARKSQAKTGPSKRARTTLNS
jgi:hypothetical protein